MEKRMFNGGLTRFWWIPLVTGVLSLAIGIWCLCGPVRQEYSISFTVS